MHMSLIIEALSTLFNETCFFFHTRFFAYSPDSNSIIIK